MWHLEHCLQIQLPWQLPALPALGLLEVLLLPLHWIPHHPSKLVAKFKASKISKTACAECPVRDVHTKKVNAHQPSILLRGFKASNNTESAQGCNKDTVLKIKTATFQTNQSNFLTWKSNVSKIVTNQIYHEMSPIYWHSSKVMCQKQQLR